MSLDWLRLVIGGILIGLVVAAPIGAVNLVCIRRTLSFGPLNGFLSGLGAALGDGVFAVVVAFGLSAISDVVMHYQSWLKLPGGLLLIALGVHTYYHEPIELNGKGDKTAALAGARDLPHTIASTFLLTVTNPATLFTFTVVIAGGANDLGYTHTAPAAALLVLSVIAGSCLWWFLLTLLIGLLHGQISTAWLDRINKISGAVIGLSGLGLLISLLFET
jgi:threonine/homoserine/homoserine lactone efflux protein